MQIVVRHHGASGPLVVVLHGGPGAPGSARGLAKLLSPFCRVLEPLQRRADDTPLTVERHLDDLAAVAPRATVVGWSWGAMLGLSFAVRCPQQVSSLVLVGCGTYSQPDRDLYQARLDAALGARGRARRDELAAAIADEPSPTLRDRLLAELGEHLSAAQGVDLLEEEDPNEGGPDARGYQQAWADAMRRQAEGLEPAAFAAIRAPVLMLHGADDPHPGAATYATLRRFLPALEYQSLPRCGHQPWRERHARADFARLVCEWLRRHASDAPRECGDQS